MADGAKVLSLGPSALSLATYSRKLIDGAIKHGGCTLNTLAYQANAPKSGFVVGGASDVLVISADKLHGHEAVKARKDVRDWLASNIDEDNYPAFPFVGSWKDNGGVFFDFCNIYESIDDALNLARARKEIAIYDLAAGESIFVD